MIVVVLTFLKHNGLCGQVIGSCQWCSQSIMCTNFCICSTSFVCMLREGMDVTNLLFSRLIVKSSNDCESVS